MWEGPTALKDRPSGGTFSPEAVIREARQRRRRRWLVAVIAVAAFVLVGTAAGLRGQRRRQRPCPNLTIDPESNPANCSVRTTRFCQALPRWCGSPPGDFTWEIRARVLTALLPRSMLLPPAWSHRESGVFLSAR